MSVVAPAVHDRAGRLWAALLAATLLNLPLGSVYSFSVLLRPIEQELAIPRSALSLVFALASAGFTADLLLTRRWFVVLDVSYVGTWIAVDGVREATGNARGGLGLGASF